MPDPIWITITLVALLFSAVFSAAEIAFITNDRVRVGIDVSRGGLIGRIINRFYSDSEFFISSILVGNNIMLVVYGMGFAKILEPKLDEWLDGNEVLVLLCQTIISTIIILFTGEFLPKTAARINPHSSLKLMSLPVFCFYCLFYPISWLSNAISDTIMRLAGIRQQSGDKRRLSIGDLNDYIEETIDSMAEKKETVENEVKIFQNALDFSSTHLRDCMLPRNEIVAVDINTATRPDLVELFTRTGRSKIIVYKNDIDTIIGYIHVSELFDPEADWRKRLKDVIFAPETLLANKMMRRMLSEKRSIAIIVDEFGGTAGLVTLEDLVEEICGDIRDEHDTSSLTARQTGPDTFEFSGRCEIENINNNYHLDIKESDDYQTLAGYIINATSTLPEQGASVLLGNLRFDILRTTANRIELIRVTRISTADE